MNKLIFVAIFATFFGCFATSPPHPCQCWPDWIPIKDGDEWHCKNPTTLKTFHCNIDQPPICTCQENGYFIPRTRGEVNCVEIGRTFDHTNCESTPDWEAWFSKYPQYRLHQ